MTKSKTSLSITLIICIFLANALVINGQEIKILSNPSNPESSRLIWYDQPADLWVEALPIEWNHRGNGLWKDS